MGLLSPTPESGKGECHAVKGKSTLLRIRGLRKRWIFSSVGPILLILVLVSVILALSLASGYYNSARTTLKNQGQRRRGLFQHLSHGHLQRLLL